MSAPQWWPQQSCSGFVRRGRRLVASLPAPMLPAPVAAAPGPRECLAGVALASFAAYYLIGVVKRPTLVCRAGPFRDYLQRHVQLLSEKFWPTLWCFEARLHTIIASLLRSSIVPDIKYKREILKLADGGEVALDWMDKGCPKDSPIVIVLPGLTGASQAEYIKCLVNGGLAIGVRTVIFNNRGLGGMELKTPRLYCASNYEDLAEVIRHVKDGNPDSLVGATGISMGGLILGNYLAGRGKECELRASMIISVPWNVFKGCDSIEKPYINNLLCRHLASSLLRTIEKSEIVRESADGRWDFAEVMQSTTIRHVDARFTSKNFGYKDVDEYYSAATLHDKLHRIAIPCLCLSAADDPFQPLEAIPVEEAEKSEHVAIMITARGGHIGFMEGLWPREPREQYMARLFAQYFQAVFEEAFETEVLRATN